MAIIKNTAGQGLYVYAHDTAADAAKTGDAANITATISKDGSTPAAATNDTNPTEIGGGVYWFDLTQAETNAGVLALIPVSATGDVVLDPVLVVTDDAAISSRLAPAVAGRTLAVDGDGVPAANVTMWQGIAASGNAYYVLEWLYQMIEVAGLGQYAFNETALTRMINALGMSSPNLDDQLAALPDSQGIRDAMKLAPSAGDPAAGSVDKHLDDLLEDTGTTLPGLIAVCASVIANSTDATASGAITRKRGNSWSIALTLGDITGYTSLWFTVKRGYDDADSAALLQVKLNSPSANDGLLYVNGTAATNAALGSITVSDASTGAIVVAVDETITDDLYPGSYYYDAQALIAGAVTTPDSGTFTVTADVTRSVA